MKKIIILALTALLFFAVGIFSACNEQDFKEEQTVGENQTLDDEKGSGKAEEVHVWGEREIVFDPDCVTNGLAICHCKECGASKAEKIPALGHVCEEWGSDQSVHYRICSRCGEKYDTSEHFFGEDLSCDECGYVCDYTLGLEYEKTDGREEYRLTGFGEFTGEVLTVPATYKGLPVTEVGEYALCNVQAKKIVLPDSVLSIGYQAFKGAAAEEIVLPKFAKTLGDAAFYGCNSLKIIVLPEGLRRIGNSTFSLCLSLRSIVIPDSVTEIGYQAFDHCYTLTKITLGKNLESIETLFCSATDSLRSTIVLCCLLRRTER